MNSRTQSGSWTDIETYVIMTSTGRRSNIATDVSGEFFTPTSIVRLIVEIIEPYHGRIFDSACGNGGMFVQSAQFVQEHKTDLNRKLSIYGKERVDETGLAESAARRGALAEPIQTTTVSRYLARRSS